MSFIEQFKTLPREEVKQALFDILNGKAMDVLSTMQEDGTQIDEGADGQFHVKNPKIDLYHKETKKYLASTNWSSTVKHAVTAMERKHPKLVGLITAKKATNEDVNESASTEEFVNEGVRKIADYCCGRHKATTHKDSDSGEYTVKFHTDGKHAKDADYFTDDKEDAAGTAKKQVDDLHDKDSK